jgi:hypothetical protein
MNHVRAARRASQRLCGNEGVDRRVAHERVRPHIFCICTLFKLKPGISYSARIRKSHSDTGTCPDVMICLQELLTVAHRQRSCRSDARTSGESALLQEAQCGAWGISPNDWGFSPSETRVEAGKPSIRIRSDDCVPTASSLQRLVTRVVDDDTTFRPYMPLGKSDALSPVALVVRGLATRVELHTRRYREDLGRSRDLSNVSLLDISQASRGTRTSGACT